MKSTNHYLIRFIALVPLLSSLPACTGGFQVMDLSSKSDFLENSRALAANASSSGAASGANLASPGTSPGSANANTVANSAAGSAASSVSNSVANSVANSGPLSIYVSFRRECSDAITEEVGYNLMSARQLVLEVYRSGYSNQQLVDGSITPVCVDSRDWRGAFSSSFDRLETNLNCDLELGSYKAFLRDPTFVADEDEDEDRTEIASFNFEVKSSAAGKVIASISNDHRFLLLDYNDTSNHLKIPAVHPELCDGTGNSPLAIQFSDAGAAIDLSSPQDGIWFDIAGANARPIPHSPYLISWTNSESLKWIVKPNHNGEVLGIDEMFGNNTQGPDGRFADDGFNALAKFDGTDQEGQRRIQAPDGMITGADAVYDSLRLWSDLNRDGKSQPDELMTLIEADIAALDLRFDPTFREVDQYGNEVKYKSVAYSSSGRPRLIFDIWFK